MGRIDAPPPRPLAPRTGSVGWKIASAVLAAVVLALGAYELGHRRQAVPVLAVARTVAATTTQPAPAEAAPSPAPAPIEEPTAEPGPTLTPSFQSAVMEVTIPRPSPVRQLADEPPSPEPTRVPAETVQDAMTRCLTFRIEDDEIHAAYMPTKTQVRASVTNNCDFGFAGPDVWIEVRAVSRHGGGTAAREVASFQGGPIEARGRAEMVLVLDCPMCYAASHRLEIGLSWPPAGDRR